MTKDVFLYLCNVQIQELNNALNSGEYKEDSLLYLLMESGMQSIYPIGWDEQNKRFYLMETELNRYFDLSKDKGVDIIVVKK